MKKYLFLSVVLILLLSLSACSQESKFQKKRQVIEESIEEASEYDLKWVFVSDLKEKGISISVYGSENTDPLSFELFVKEMLQISVTAAKKQNLEIESFYISSDGGFSAVDRPCFKWHTFDCAEGFLSDERAYYNIGMPQIKLDEIAFKLENSLSNYGTEMRGLEEYLEKKNPYKVDAIYISTGTANEQFTLHFHTKTAYSNALVITYFDNSVSSITKLVKEYLSETPIPIKSLFFTLTDQDGKSIKSGLENIIKQ